MVTRCNLYRDRNSIPLDGYDSRYPATPHYQSMGAIKKTAIVAESETIGGFKSLLNNYILNIHCIGRAQLRIWLERMHSTSIYGNNRKTFRLIVGAMTFFLIPESMHIKSSRKFVLSSWNFLE